MSWISQKLKGVFKKDTKYADMMSGYTPIFGQFGNNIYASDVVRQAIDCIVKEVAKLEPCYIRKTGNDYRTPKNDRRNIQQVLANPNPIMGKSDFLEKITWQLYLNDNAFVVPVYEAKKDGNGNETRTYKALYPIAPSTVNFLEDQTGRLYIQFEFNNGFKTMLPYSDVIHIRNNYSVNDYMGGDETGQPDYKALISTLQLNKDLLTGVSAAMKSSFVINGIVRAEGIISEDKLKKETEKFNKKLMANESGILFLDGKSTYQAITRDVKLVDSDTLKFVDEKILRHFGVPLPILVGDYTKEQYEAFYQKTIEGLVGRLGEAFTRVLCTDKMASHGDRISFFTNELIFMSTQQKIEMVKYLGDTGTIFENEKRVALGMAPSPELEGVRKQSLNYVDVDIVREYQLLKAKGGSKE